MSDDTKCDACIRPVVCGPRCRKDRDLRAARLARAARKAS